MFSTEVSFPRNNILILSATAAYDLLSENTSSQHGHTEKSKLKLLQRAISFESNWLCFVIAKCRPIALKKKKKKEISVQFNSF
jgi:hypothetical protein